MVGIRKMDVAKNILHNMDLMQLYWFPWYTNILNGLIVN